jgi:hypothetical protein
MCFVTDCFLRIIAVMADIRAADDERDANFLFAALERHRAHASFGALSPAEVWPGLDADAWFSSSSSFLAMIRSVPVSLACSLSVDLIWSSDLINCASLVCLSVLSDTGVESESGRYAAIGLPVCLSFLVNPFFHSFLLLCPSSSDIIIMVFLSRAQAHALLPQTDLAACTTLRERQQAAATAAHAQVRG